MKRVILDRLDELPLFILTICMSVWAFVPYKTSELRAIAEKQAVVTKHCYVTSGDDTVIQEDATFRTIQKVYELYARQACVEIAFPRGSIHVESISQSSIVIVLTDPVVDVTYGKAVPFAKEGTLPLNRRIALSTKIRNDLRQQCGSEAKQAGITAVANMIHGLSKDLKVTIKLSPTNWCENGPEE